MWKYYVSVYGFGKNENAVCFINIYCDLSVLTELREGKKVSCKFEFIYRYILKLYLYKLLSRYFSNLIFRLKDSLIISLINKTYSSSNCIL
ncbi:hypothetical protein Aasi_1259 [Candidatus Amoebophilus asiaticus 5a2]|uniref:Uncharacterized protein n=1 Tax=Amoebophilus asiaticus (strain 5a2) TaxID=452471 RepID=B3ETM9_AMOA5|nr:hypothetical protein Aasi_1259 [Candidatus Amoebophilus asiaticus 5a2]